tara:strand:- start:2073 stop:3023 length:951 start_codon:yes stop_codon:yes gene_type:complete
MANNSLRQLSDALNIATAQLSGDPQRMQMALGMQQSRKLQEEAAARQQKLQQFVQANPSLAKMYELFGEKGLQQGYLQQQEQQQKLIERQQQIQALQGAGFSNQEINLVLAGVPTKDVIDFRETGELSGQELINKVEENVETTIEQTGILNTFANLDEAFGPVDAAQEALSKATRVLGFDVEAETGAAVRARNSLNTEILANLAADFTGRPNLLIYENLKGNLPMSAATSEADAREKYINVKDQVDARINNLKQGLKSTTVSDSDKEKYREELNKSILLSKKLDSAILSLSPKKEETLKPTNLDMQSEGFYSWIYE